jgi:hypothetical protein
MHAGSGEAARINRRPHPLRRERRFPHSLSVTEGVKIDMNTVPIIRYLPSPFVRAM